MVIRNSLGNSLRSSVVAALSMLAMYLVFRMRSRQVLRQVIRHFSQL